MTAMSSTYHREWYERNKEKRRAQIKANTETRRNNNREAMLKYLQEHPCVDCGELDPIVLEFDHVTGEKVMEVSRMMQQRTWPRVLDEIQKCVVRCANCHRRKTAKQLGWWSAPR